MKAIAIIAAVVGAILLLLFVFALILIAAFAMVAKDIDFRNTDIYDENEF